MNKIFLFSLLIVSLIISACGSIQFTHTLYPDWSSDITLNLSSDYDMFFSSLEESFNSYTFLENATIIENDKSSVYHVTNIEPESIKPNNETFFGAIGIKKEFVFPYYHYTLTLNNIGSDDDNMVGFEFDYILKPFGNIVQTNGVYTSNKKDAVKFNLLKTKNYTLTFKQNIFSAWMSGSSKIEDKNPLLYNSGVAKIGQAPPIPDFGANESNDIFVFGSQEAKENGQVVNNTLTQNKQRDCPACENCESGFERFVMGVNECKQCLFDSACKEGFLCLDDFCVDQNTYLQRPTCEQKQPGLITQCDLSCDNCEESTQICVREKINQNDEFRCVECDGFAQNCAEGYTCHEFECVKE